QRNRTVFAAAATGLAHRALHLAREHLSQRVLYGKPLITQPTIQSRFAQLSTDLHAAWLLVSSAAASWDAGTIACQESSMAKLFAGRPAVRCASEALEFFGGYGYTQEYEVERLYRDAKLFEIIEGPTLVQEVLIARELFSDQLKPQLNRVLKSAA